MTEHNEELNTYFCGYEAVSDDIFSLLTLENISPVTSMVEVQPVYRSVPVMHDSVGFPNIGHIESTMDKVHNVHGSSKNDAIDLIPIQKVSVIHSNPPALPTLLLNTNFEISLSLNSLVSKIDRVFNEIEGLTFQFFADTFEVQAGI